MEITRKEIASAVKAKLQAGEKESDERSLEVAAIALETELDQYISTLPAKNKKKGRVCYLMEMITKNAKNASK